MEYLLDIGDYGLSPQGTPIWESDLEPEAQDALKYSTDASMPDYISIEETKMAIMHEDIFMSETLLEQGITAPIKTEHSYSLTSDGDSIPESPRSLNAKMEDMDDECYEGIPMNINTSNGLKRLNRHSVCIKTESNSSNSGQDTASIISSSSDIDVDDSFIKQEPMSPESSCPSSPKMKANINGIMTPRFHTINLANTAAFTNTDLVMEHKNGTAHLTIASQSLLKGQSNGPNPRLVMPKNLTGKNDTNNFGLPPTPPSSLPSDDSEGNQSPEHHVAPLSPPAQNQMSGVHSTTLTTSTSTTTTRRSTALANNSTSQSTRGYTSSTRQPIHTPLISSQPKGSTGTLVLTEEEKRTLLAEGYPIPTRLPLTKAEEKSLKKIRRKIKNKISAQESRRKKKEYMDLLERKVEVLATENVGYKKRVESLEETNASLLKQLAKLQALVSRQTVKRN